MWKALVDSKKAKCLSKEEIKKSIIRFDVIIDEVVKLEDLNKEAKEIQDPEKAVEIVKRYEDINKMKKKGIIKVVYHQGKVFKRFKQKEQFATLVSEFGIHRSSIIFKINFFKLCEKYRKLLKSSIGLGFFKDYHKDIKAIC